MRLCGKKCKLQEHKEKSPTLLFHKKCEDRKRSNTFFLIFIKTRKKRCNLRVANPIFQTIVAIGGGGVKNIHQT